MQGFWKPERVDGNGISPGTLLGGSWDLVSRVISTLIGVISKYNYSYLSYNLSY